MKIRNSLMSKLGKVVCESSVAFMHGYNSVDTDVVIADCNGTSLDSDDLDAVAQADVVIATDNVDATVNDLKSNPHVREVSREEFDVCEHNNTRTNECSDCFEDQMASDEPIILGAK